MLQVVLLSQVVHDNLQGFLCLLRQWEFLPNPGGHLPLHRGVHAFRNGTHVVMFQP